MLISPFPTKLLVVSPRGDIKVGQVRELMSLVSQLRAEHGGCPAMVMGDFNSTPGSAVHHFAGEGRLALAGLSRCSAHASVRPYAPHAQLMPSPSKPGT